MSVERIEKEQPLELALKVNIAPAQYNPKVKGELQKYQQKAQMKGFRKGKVPMSMVRKMYGKAILIDVINECVQTDITQYIEEQKLNTIGQPIAGEDQKEINFDLGAEQDFEFFFDLGLAPELNPTGIDKDSVYRKWVVEVSDERAEEELTQLQKRAGEQIHPEDDIEEEDVLSINATELSGDEAKPQGVESSFQMPVDRIQPDSLRSDILKMKAGDTFRFDPFTLEADRDETFVRKYILKLDEADSEREVGSDFEGTIAEVNRVKPAELNEEFYQQIFGADGAKTKEEALTEIKKWIRDSHNRQAEALLYREFQDRLMSENEMPLPDEFLHRWLTTTSENADEEQVAKEYESFARSLRWNLIESHIRKEHDLQVESSEVRDVMVQQVQQSLGGYQVSPEFVSDMVQRLMQDEKQVQKAYEERMGDKIFEKILELVTIEEEPISIEGLNEKMEEARKTVDNGGEEE